jgi:hypothetical protein
LALTFFSFIRDDPRSNIPHTQLKTDLWRRCHRHAATPRDSFGGQLRARHTRVGQHALRPNPIACDVQTFYAGNVGTRAALQATLLRSDEGV